MKNILLLIFLLMLKINVIATAVYVKDYGWNSDDMTTAFQQAVNSPADTILITKQSSDWIVGPNSFKGLQNKTIIFMDGVVFRSKAGAFIDKNDCLLQFVQCNHIKILGYGAIFQMNKAEYAAMDNSEWRHSISINNSSNIEIYGLKLIESGGDGIFISGYEWLGDQKYSDHIILKDLWCDRHYRQGISIISVEHLFVQNCWFTNTSGTLPMSGVDIEPDNEHFRIVDVVFEKCRFTDNYGNGIQLSLENLSNRSLPVDVTFRDCYTSNNYDVNQPYKAAEIFCYAADKDAVKGTVKFIRCMVENSQWSAVRLRKTAESYLASFDDCVFTNVSQRSVSNNMPIWLEPTDFNAVRRFGGAVFNNCLITYNADCNFLGLLGDLGVSAGMGNVQLNNLTVINPNPGISIDTISAGGSPDGACRFDFKHYRSAPATTVSIDSENFIIECTGKNSTIKTERKSKNITYPLGVTYEISGINTQAIDFSRMTGFMIIPHNSRVQEDILYVIKDSVSENPKEYVQILNKSFLYSANSRKNNITVSDCIDIQ